MAATNKPQLAIRYFQCWANRDLASLELMLDEDVMLVDWDGPVLGRDKVLQFTKELYDTTKIIAIDIKKVAIGQDCVMAELEITLNRKKLYVVDVLDYNQENKIQRIRAYKL
jgi:hypothetical protein